MPASFGVTNLFDLTIPVGGVVEESSSDSEVEAKTIRDQSGTTCRAVPGKLKKTTVSIKGRGQASLATVTTGALSGTVKVISAKNAEGNDDFPTFETTGVKYETL